MPTSAERVRRAQAALAARARRDVARVWPKVVALPAPRVAPVMAEVLEAVAEKYGPAAGAIAADYYDELREGAKASGRFAPAVAALPEAERFKSLAGWGAGPLFGAEPDSALALSRMSGGLSRIVQNVGRDTITDAVVSDPAGPTYARHASANACAFCAMLATRGPIYTSSSNAGTLGSKYHDDCHCTVVPVFPGQTYREAPYVKRWREAYAESPSGKTKEVLSTMREQLGTN